MIIGDLLRLVDWNFVVNLDLSFLSAENGFQVVDQIQCFSGTHFISMYRPENYKQILNLHK